MTERNDMELVRDYARCNSESAFAELVQRHVNLVYSVALRYVGNSTDAQDVAQAVFIILAKKSASLRDKTVIIGWLYETTRFTAINFLRTKIRRESREQEAYMESTANDSDTVSVWQQIAPHLEDAMTRLSEKERTLLALHFFENKSGAETAAALGIAEWAARKRVTRAVEKLRQFFMKQGVTISAPVLTGAILSNSVQAAPAGLATAISLTAVTHGAAAAGSTLILVNGALKLMTWTNTKTAIVGALAAFGVATPLILQHQSNLQLREENRALQLQMAAKPGDATPQTDSVELDRLQSEKAELLRLRDEVGRLRSERLAQAKERFEARSQVPPIPPKVENNFLPKDSWVDAGFATPEAALQTRGWTVLNANRERFKESVLITDDGRRMLEDMLEKMIAAAPDPAQARQDIEGNGLTLEDAMLFPMLAQNKSSGGFSGYQILSRQSPGENEQILEVETQTSTGPAQREKLKFRRMEEGWKVVIDAEMITAKLK